MKRYFREKRGVVAAFVMITHVFSLFSAEGQIAGPKQATFMKIPWIIERTVTVPEEIWKEHYEGLQVQKSGLPWTVQEYHPQSFHSWATALILDDNLLGNGEKFWGADLIDDRGFTPLHYLVKRRKATIKQVQTLVLQGADITRKSRDRIGDNGSKILGVNAYRNALAIGGNSPVDKSLKGFFENQCQGNKDVIEYVFTEILHKKLSVVAGQRKTQEEIIEIMRRADMVLLQELRKSLGLPAFESSSPCRKNYG
jgi:hypothetical protein